MGQSELWLIRGSAFIIVPSGYLLAQIVSVALAEERKCENLCTSSVKALKVFIFDSFSVFFFPQISLGLFSIYLSLFPLCWTVLHWLFSLLVLFCMEMKPVLDLNYFFIWFLPSFINGFIEEDPTHFIVFLWKSSCNLSFFAPPDLKLCYGHMTSTSLSTGYAE